MKKLPSLLLAGLALAVLATHAEASLSSRKKEKAETYATLKTWQKRYVDTGVIAQNFNPDMVYIAIGKPSKKIQAKDGELWIYKNFYPSEGAEKVKATLNTERGVNQNVITGMLTDTTGLSGSLRTASPSQGGTAPSISRTGGAQGGSMEPADLRSYTFYVAFENGVVTQMRLTPNN